MAMMTLFLASLALSGCAASDGPSELLVPASRYAAAFDAAVEAARREGLHAIILDRRAGIIETDTRHAATLLEPWRQDNAGLRQAVENTIAQQAVRVRFEFVPADEPPAPLDVESRLAGRDVSGTTASITDLTARSGDLRLIATVAVERTHRTGVRRSTWSRRHTTQTRIFEREDEFGEPSPLPATVQAVIARDEAFERRLLGSIEAMLATPREAAVR